MLRYVEMGMQAQTTNILETRASRKRHNKKASAAACKLQAANIGSLTYPVNGTFRVATDKIMVKWPTK